MPEYKCNTCGGKLSIKIGSDIAACESCGNYSDISHEEVKKYSKIYASAERQMRTNSVSGHNKALQLLQTISFIGEAQDKISFCENRLAEIKVAEAKRAEVKKQADKNDTKIGIIIIVLIMLVILFVVAGVIYIAVHLYRGDLSPKAVLAIISVVIICAIITLIGEIKS